jgi:hypothetical protein
MRSFNVLLCFLVFFLIPSLLKAQDCTPLAPRQQISEKTTQDITGAAQTVFKVGRVEGSYKGVTEKEVRNLYDKYPGADKVDTHGLTPVALAKEVFIYLEGCMPSNSL